MNSNQDEVLVRAGSIPLDRAWERWLSRGTDDPKYKSLWCGGGSLTDVGCNFFSFSSSLVPYPSRVRSLDENKTKNNNHKISQDQSWPRYQHHNKIRCPGRPHTHTHTHTHTYTYNHKHKPIPRTITFLKLSFYFIWRPRWLDDSRSTTNWKSVWTAISERNRNNSRIQT